jgi:hypothetical protein
MAGIENFRADRAEDCEQIAVGDWVRSYDFEYADDCYIIGRVTDVDYDLGGCNRYAIEAYRRIYGGEDESDNLHVANHRFYPPMNGTPNSFGGYCNGVRKLEGEELEFWTEKHADWASDVEIY